MIDLDSKEARQITADIAEWWATLAFTLDRHSAQIRNEEAKIIERLAAARERGEEKA